MIPKEAVGIAVGYVDSKTKKKIPYKIIIHNKLLVFEKDGKTIKRPYDERLEEELKREKINYTIEEVTPDSLDLEIIAACEQLRLPLDKVREYLEKREKPTPKKDKITELEERLSSLENKLATLENKLKNLGINI